MSEQRTTGLLAAAARGDHEFLQNALSKIDQNLDSLLDNHKYTLLHHAVASNSLKCVETVIECANFCPTLRTNEGQTPLFLAVSITTCPLEIIQKLMDFCPEYYDIPNNESVYPIHKAVLNKRFEAVKILIETMKNKNRRIYDYRDLENENAILLAARVNSIEMIKYFVTNTNFNTKLRNDQNLNVLQIYCLSDDANVDHVDDLNFLQSIAIDGDTDDVSNYFKTAMLFILGEKLNGLKWFTERFYFVDSNEHQQMAKFFWDLTESFEINFSFLSLLCHQNAAKIFQDENLAQFYDLFRRTHLEQLYLIFTYDPAMIRLFGKHYSKTIPEYFKMRCLEDIVPALKDIVGKEPNRDEKILGFMTAFGVMTWTHLFPECFRLNDDADELFYNLPYLLPLSTMLYANEITDDLTTDLPDGYWGFNWNIREFKNLCDQKVCSEPLRLDVLSRIVIRYTVFRNFHFSNNTLANLKALVSLELPKSVKNFLLFNNTNFDLAAEIKDM